jgi:hypothetical protein
MHSHLVIATYTHCRSHIQILVVHRQAYIGSYLRSLNLLILNVRTDVLNLQQTAFLIIVIEAHTDCSGNLHDRPNDIDNFFINNLLTEIKL